MNPAELRMMWMSQYNPERMSLEDAASFFGPSVGLSIVEDIAQPQMDINPMMSIVGGDFSGQAAAAAAAAAALGVPQTTLIAAANSNDIYGLTHVGAGGSLQQQLLQQTATSSASAMFQSNYAELTDEDDGTAGGASVSDDQQNVYDPMDDAYDDGALELTPKQEIINIDDYVVMMNDSNSYDGSDYVPGSEKDGLTTAHQSIEDDDHKLLLPISEQHKLLGVGDGMILGNLGVAATTSTRANVTGHQRNQRKTRKIEPVNRPGLVLKTPIAYKGNIDPSVIPIQKDGMAVCERCGAIGVKHTFYTKSRRFCSMSCARGELYSLVLNNKMAATANQKQQNAEQTALDSGELTDEGSSRNKQQQQDAESDIELALRVSHIKNANYGFRLSDAANLTQQMNGLPDSLKLNAHSALAEHLNKTQLLLTNDSSNGGGSSNSGVGDGTDIEQPPPPPKALRMYHDVLPQEDLPQIPKFDRLPASCPQMEKMISIRRRVYDPTHSYDWIPHLKRPDFFAASVTSFPHAPGYDVWHSIDIDMKVEVENTDCDNLEIIQPGQTPHSFWVATILNICGYKALMRYEGFDDDSHDFWVNLCNTEVHAVGWCATRGKPLIPPRTIEKKYKDWKDFLVERLSGARTLPSNFYNKINDSMQSRFRAGLNLECVDKDKISQVRLATVTKIVGKRLCLRYFDNENVFWCHEDSPIIHPVGWATTVGHDICAPPDYMARMLAGRDAMIEVHEDDATIELFKMNFTFEEYYMEGKLNGFVEGMKLEAVDPLNLSAICAATVMAVLKFGYMMIRIDSYPVDAAGSDWFCYHEKSASIFPVGFCAAHNIVLTPPKEYDVNTFSWEQYLQETGSIAAGQHLFHCAVPNHGFHVGMSLECADLMDPHMVCVAHVGRVVGRLLRIKFDGWSEEYDQWLDCESPDIYPVGWCVLVNHKLEGPRLETPVAKAAPKSKSQKKRKKKVSPTKSHDTQASNSTTVVKTRTIALKTTPHLPKLSIKLGLKPEHHKASFYEHNGDDEEDFEDDTISHRSDQSTPLSNVTSLAATEISTNSGCSDKSKTSTTTAATATTTPTNIQGRPNATTTVKKTISIAPPATGRKATSYIANSSVSSSKYIPRLSDISSNDNNLMMTTPTTATATTSGNGGGNSNIGNIDELMPETWNIYDVSQFLRVNDCTAHCDTFSRNKIDGKRFLQLSKDEIITLLGMKVGPALKIFDLIQQLKCKINPNKSRLHKANKTSFL